MIFFQKNGEKCVDILIKTNSMIDYQAECAQKNQKIL